MFRTLFASAAGAGGAATASLPATDPATQRYMLKLMENTGLDPAAMTYAQDGMSPIWAFATVATIGMGPHMAAAARRWMEDRSADQTRRLEAELSGFVEKGPDDE